MGRQIRFDQLTPHKKNSNLYLQITFALGTEITRPHEAPTNRTRISSSGSEQRNHIHVIAFRERGLIANVELIFQSDL